MKRTEAIASVSFSSRLPIETVFALCRRAVQHSVFAAVYLSSRFSSTALPHPSKSDLMEAPARALLAEGASRVVAWKKTPTSSSSATVLFSSFSPPPTDDELSSLERLFEDREAAIRSGMVLEGKRFEVRGEGRGKRTKTENRKKQNSGEERELVLPIFFKAQPETKRPQKPGPPPPPPSGIRPRDGH